jgi:hypothetical protein
VVDEPLVHAAVEPAEAGSKNRWSKLWWNPLWWKPPPRMLPCMLPRMCWAKLIPGSPNKATVPSTTEKQTLLMMHLLL